MAAKVVGVSLQEETLERLDELARREGESRSGMIGRLVERARDRSVPDVRVDGRRFVPAREKRA